MATSTVPAVRHARIGTLALVAALVGGIAGMGAVASHLSGDRAVAGAAVTTPHRTGPAPSPGT